MSLVADPSKTTREVAIIRSLDEKYPLHNKMVLVETNPHGQIAELYNKAREIETKREQWEADDDRPSFKRFKTAFGRTTTTEMPTMPSKRAILQHMAEQERKTKQTQISLGPLEIFEPTVWSSTRVAWSIFGPSGSGKSSLAVNICREYNRVFPDRPIWWISCVEHDDVDNAGIRNFNRILIDESWTQEPFDFKDLADSLSVWDDIDTGLDDKKDLYKAIHSARDDLLERGRHINASVISTSHIFFGNAKTNIQRREATHVAVFPGSGSKGLVERYLRSDHGLDKKRIAGLLSQPSRWMVLSVTAPKYVLFEKKCELLS